MKFTPGFWTHEKFMDVAIEILKVQYQDEKRAKLKIHWWNRGWVGEPFRPFPTPNKLKITDFSGWKPLKKLERLVDEV